MTTRENAADIVIRGGTIFDGSGNAPFEADVAVNGGQISEIGKNLPRGKEEISAKGKMVAPGFVDIHTHYDGQLFWESKITPSSSHGVTTVVAGNCGVGFAPCRLEDRGSLMKLLDGVEDIPESVLTEGLPWNWETFPEFIEAAKSIPHDIDFALQLPHAPLRTYVMGARARGDAPTEQDLSTMRRIAKEAVEAGAIGFSTSRNVFQASRDGTIISSFFAKKEELLAIAKGLQDAGGGVMEVLLPIAGGRDIEDFKMILDVSRQTNVPFSYIVAQTKYEPHSWKTLLELTSRANAEGIQVTPQATPRATGMLFGLDLSYHAFTNKEAYQRIAHLPLSERVAEMRKPEVRAAILAPEAGKGEIIYQTYTRDFRIIYELGTPPNYEPKPDQSLELRAKRMGITPEELMYDLMLENDGRTFFLCTAANFESKNFDAVEEMMHHPNSVVCLGDGGAHYSTICDSNYPTFMLSYWGRDRSVRRMPLEKVVNYLSRKPALAMGFLDRGLLQPGHKADLNVIDIDNLHYKPLRMVADLPAGGRRIVQDAAGYIATIVSGTVIQRDGEATGAFPGALVSRGQHRTPKSSAA